MQDFFKNLKEVEEKELKHLFKTLGKKHSNHFFFNIELIYSLYG